MKTLSNELHTAYKKMALQESNVYMQSVQKVLKLFGYGNSQDAQYICCLGTTPRIDIHKYRLGTRNFVMCIVTNSDSNVTQAALWVAPYETWKNISRNTFNTTHDIVGIDEVLNNITQGNYNLVMKY